MYCDVIQTNHQVKAMFISTWAPPWITYDAITKAKERAYELFIIDSDRQIKAIIESRKAQFIINDKA